MTFSKALDLLIQGERVTRQSWNGKNMWLVLIHPGNATYRGFDMQPCIGIKTANNTMQPGWLASQNDLLSDDWEVLS